MKCPRCGEQLEIVLGDDDPRTVDTHDREGHECPACGYRAAQVFGERKSLGQIVADLFRRHRKPKLSDIR